MYTFRENDASRSIEGRYWNCQGLNIAIVATITKGIDWAAYIGADDSPSEKAALNFIADYGSKLQEADARHFFPDIELPYRR